MDDNTNEDLLKILKNVHDQNITPEEALKKIDLLTLDRIGNHSLIDLGRQARSGIPEVILAEWKANDHLRDITSRFVKQKGFAFLTRMKEEQVHVLETLINEQSWNWEKGIRSVIVYDPERFQFPASRASIGILSGGTSDYPVVEEAAYMARLMGVHPIVHQDVGIAGVHRLFKPLQQILEHDAKCIVVVAGMEGALPSLVASLVKIPVIGVPVSTGYGFGGGGKAALMTMLQSCVPGLTVVNIDNGVNAGATAALIALQSTPLEKE